MDAMGSRQALAEEEGTMATVAVGYVRRSKASDERTVSLAVQEAAIRAYCAGQGWTLAGVVSDDGVSGGKRTRLARLTAAVRASRAGAVVVHALDRFARDAAAVLDSLRAFGRVGVELHVAGRGRLEVVTSAGLLAVGMEALVAEHFRAVVAEKTRAALGLLRAAGRCYSGVPPYGYRAVAGRLEPEDAEQAALATMRALRAVGVGYRALAVELAERGVRQRNGRPWSPQLLHRVLTRPPIDLSVDGA
jgi:DNA invertase Pin-like site-specific DNA recombinase